MTACYTPPLLGKAQLHTIHSLLAVNDYINEQLLPLSHRTLAGDAVNLFLTLPQGVQVYPKAQKAQATAAPLQGR